MYCLKDFYGNLLVITSDEVMAQRMAREMSREAEEPAVYVWHDDSCIAAYEYGRYL